MEKNNIIEKVGYITKTELISSMNQKIVRGTFVAEGLAPFPGYNGENIPRESKPEYIFLFTKVPYTNPKIARVTSKIKKYCPHEFIANNGRINYYNEDHPCIRLKNLDSFDTIADIQQCYKDEGIEFSKSQSIKIEGIFEFQKYFFLKQENEGIYWDVEKEEISYIKIPKHLNWKLFEQVTRSVKNNVENNNFDAALAAFYSDKGMDDYVRVYAEHMTAKYLKQLQETYLVHIKKFE